MKQHPYTVKQATRAYERILYREMLGMAEQEAADAAFDAGEWSRAWHHEQQDYRDSEILALVAARFAIPAHAIECQHMENVHYDHPAERELRREFAPCGICGEPIDYCLGHGSRAPTCNNPDVHAMFEERGVGDQCPHCIVGANPERIY